MGRNLAQVYRNYFHQRVSFFLWLLYEIAIAAGDLAELVGSAIALKLLFSTSSCPDEHPSHWRELAHAEDTAEQSSAAHSRN